MQMLIIMSLIKCLKLKFLQFKIMHSKWVYGSNSKYLWIGAKFDMHIKNIENM